MKKLKKIQNVTDRIREVALMPFSQFEFVCSFESCKVRKIQKYKETYSAVQYEWISLTVILVIFKEVRMIY